MSMYIDPMVDVPAGDWITVAEASELMGVSKRRVQVLIKAGRIPAQWVGYQLLIRREDVTGFRPKPVGRPPKKKLSPKKRKGKS